MKPPVLATEGVIPTVAAFQAEGGISRGLICGVGQVKVARRSHQSESSDKKPPVAGLLAERSRKISGG